MLYSFLFFLILEVLLVIVPALFIATCLDVYHSEILGLMLELGMFWLHSSSLWGINADLTRSITPVVLYFERNNFSNLTKCPLQYPPLKRRELHSEGQPNSIKLNPNWVTGFIDGEGSFIIAILPSTGPFKKKVSLRLSVTQSSHSVGVLYALQNFFDCGQVIASSKGCMRFVVQKYFK